MNNQEKLEAYKTKMEEVDKLLAPYTITHESGMKELTIPNVEIALKRQQLLKEASEIRESIK